MQTKITSVLMPALAVVVACNLLFLPICRAEDAHMQPANGESRNASRIIGILNLLAIPTLPVLTPYLNSNQIRSIPEAYSEDATAPWGFEHRGIDFCPNVQLASFQAAFSGVIEVVDLHENIIDPDTSYWHVNVKLVHDAVWSAWYAFEPMSESQADGVTQRLWVTVSQGDYVQAGDLMGRLFVVDQAAAHVHFTLNKNDEPVCPESYFTPQAKASVLYIIHKDHPTWNMCYY